MIDNPFDPHFYPNYAPFTKKQAVPEVPSFFPDDTTVCFNSMWLPYIRGALASLMYRGMWDDNEENIDLITNHAGNLLDKFQSFTCEVAIQYRIDPDNPCIIQSSTDGVTWVTFYDPTSCFLPTDTTNFLRKVTDSNWNVITNADATLGLRIIEVDANAAQFSSEGEIALILQSFANTSGIHGTVLRLERSTAPADRQALVDVRFLEGTATPLINFDGAYIMPDFADTEETTGFFDRRGALYRQVEDEVADGIYAAVLHEPDTYELRRLAWLDELPSEGLDGAGITAVELNQIVPTATPYATLSTPSTPADQLLSLGINRGIGISSVAAVGLDAGSDPDIESTPNSDGDLDIVFGIPAGRDGVPVDDTVPTATRIDRLFVDASGSFLPYILPAGYKITSITGIGIWGKNPIIGLAAAYAFDYTGFFDAVYSEQNGQLQFAALPVGATDYDFQKNWDDTPWTADEDSYVNFSQVELSEFAQRAYGQIWIDVTIDLPTSYDWSHEFDFSIDARDWTSYSAGCAFDESTHESGVWSLDHAHSDRYNGTAMARSWTGSRTITRIEVEVKQFQNTSAFIDVRNYAETVITDTDSDCVSDQTYLDITTATTCPQFEYVTIVIVPDAPVSQDSINLQIMTDAGNTYPVSLQIRKITLFGFGSDPF